MNQNNNSTNMFSNTNNNCNIPNPFTNVYYLLILEISSQY
jgi:hypothetical protein